MALRIETLSLALLCAGGSATAAEPAPRRLGILPIDAMNVADDEAGRAESSLREILARRGTFRILPAAVVARGLRGRTAQCGREVPCLRALGRALGVDTLLALRAGRLGDTLVVQLSAFDVRRGMRQGKWEEMLRSAERSRLDAALRRMIASFAPAPLVKARPWYRRWWVWTAVGAAVAGASVAIAVSARDSSPTPDLVIRPPGP